MPCERIRLPDGTVAIVKYSNRRRRRCSQCRELVYEIHLRLCDAPGCNLPLCQRCTYSPAPDVDYCPHHRAQLELL